MKVRLGLVNKAGEQKGVDSLIVTDMITLARNGSMADAVLLSGDEDLRVGVQQAQEFGVRVHLLGIRPSRGSQSVLLLQEADSTCEWGPEDISFLTTREVEDTPAPTQPERERLRASHPAETTQADRLEGVASRAAGAIPENEIGALADNIEQSGQIPWEIDRRLLAAGRDALQALLDPEEKKKVRAAFVQALRRRLPE